MEFLERYRPLVDDFGAFVAACERPLPAVVRVNTVEATVDRVTAALEAEGVGVERADWNERVVRLDTDAPGATWPAFHGWIHGQEEVSALPATVLAPRSGERVWDACAAPGSKTTQVAALMDDEGTVVANDSDLGRLSALRFNAERLGITNVAVTNRDARNVSLRPFAADGDGRASGGSGEGSADGTGGEDGGGEGSGKNGPAREPGAAESGGDGFDAFDRALVDVPCSCEGTVRKNPDVADDWSLDHVRGVAGVQKGILRRAVQVTRPGGVVVYSTCTFAPEENEAVLNHVLAREDCRIVDADVPLAHSPGVTEWESETYDESVRKAARIYPHQNDTGGFFCAKLEVGS